jgi:hypothetical protein
MNRILCAVGLLLGAWTASAHAADLTGTWKGQLPPRDGAIRELTFRLQQNGGKLTGGLVGRDGSETPISEGRTSAGGFSFALVGPRGKMICKGTFSGREMKLSQSREGSPGLAREITFKRQ